MHVTRKEALEQWSNSHAVKEHSRRQCARLPELVISFLVDLVERF